MLRGQAAQTGDQHMGKSTNRRTCCVFSVVFEGSDTDFILHPLTVVLTYAQILVTETVQDSLSPEFTTPVVLDYFFEEVQKLQFLVFDVDDPSKSPELGGQSLGSIETTLGTVSARIRRTTHVQTNNFKRTS